MDETPKIPEAEDAEILLDGEKVAGYVVRPWTIPKCAEMTPVLESIANDMKARRLRFQDFVHFENGKFEALNQQQLFFVIMPYTPDIIAKTLDITFEELKKIPQEEMFNIMSVIIRQNVGYVKNLFALMMQTVRTLAETSSGQ